jgi:hypothetical protein
MADETTGTRYEWQGGYFAVWFEPKTNEIVWWGAEHPKGGTPYEERIEATFFIEHGLGSVDSTPPLEVLSSLYREVATHLKLPAEHPGEELCNAVSAGDLAAIGGLLDKGVKPDAANLFGKSPLECAFAAKQDAAALLLLERGASQRGGSSLFRTACYRDAFQTATYLLQGGMSVDKNVVEFHWKMSLSKAPTEFLDELLKRGASVAKAGWENVLVQKRLQADPTFAQWAARVRSA